MLIPTDRQLAVMERMAKSLAAAVAGGMKSPNGLTCAESFLARMLVGAELGIPPMTAVYAIQVEEGKVSYGAKVAVALARGLGIADLRLIESSETLATVKVHRHNWPDQEYELISFTWDDAVKAGLHERDLYKKYPRNMLAHRAFEHAIALHCQDATAGVGYIRDDEPDEMLTPDAVLDEGDADPTSPVEPPSDTEQAGPPTAPTTPPTEAATLPESAPGPADPAPPPEPDPSAGPMTEQVHEATNADIKELVKANGWAQSNWRLMLVTRFNKSKLTDMNADEAVTLLAFLQLLDKLARLRAMVGPNEDEWQRVVLAKRDIASELLLTTDDAQAIYDKLWARATPFNQQKLREGSPPSSEEEPGKSVPAATGS